MAEGPPRSTLAERWLSASAAVVAATALGVSIYQAYITREQQRMSVWPYVTQDNTGSDSSYARRVHNVGIGPALVRSVTIAVDGRRVATWRELVMRARNVDSTSARLLTRGSAIMTSSVRRGHVLLPDANVELIRATGGPAPAALRDMLNDDRVDLRVCYCSLYRECWLSSSLSMEPQPVRVCDAPDPQFRS